MTISETSTTPPPPGPTHRATVRPPAAPAGKALAALLKKESRELAPWAALSAATFAAGLAYALYILAAEFRSPISNYQNYITSFLTPLFVGVCLFIPAGAALVLGFLQFFPETKPDRFAFLVHRPATRTRVFFGKTLAGLAIYFVSMLVPLVIAMLWAKDPSHIPLPFTVDMLQAPLVDILAGIPFYFAGILAARRTDAHWFGSRLLPLLSPIPASVIVAVSTHWAWAVLAIAIASAILLMAARGAFLSAGQLRATPRHAKLGTAASLAVGLFLCGAFVLGILASLTERPRDMRTVEYRLFRDGTPIRLTREHSGSETLTATTLDGRPFPSPYAENSGENLPQVALGNGGFEIGYSVVRMIHESQHYFTEVSSTFERERWYRHRPGDYIVAFNQAGHTQVGAFGADGFEVGVATPRNPFPLPVVTGATYTISTLDSRRSTQAVLAAGDTLYAIGPDHALIKQYTAPNLEIIRGATGLLTSEQSELPPDQRKNPTAKILSFTIILTDRAVIALDSTMKPVMRYEENVASASWATVGYLPTQGLFVISTIDRTSGTSWYLSPQRVAFVKPGSTDAGPSAMLDHAINLPAAETTFGTAHLTVTDYVAPAVTPPAVVLAAIGRDHLLIRDNISDTYPAMIRYFTISIATSILIVTALMLALARRYHFTRNQTILWTIIAAALGLMSLFLMFALAWRSPLARCAHCKKPRRADQPTCDNCGTPAPPLAANGTEIFTPQLTVST